MTLGAGDSSEGTARTQERKLTSASAWRTSAALSNSGFIFLQCPHPVETAQGGYFLWHGGPGVPMLTPPPTPSRLVSITPGIWALRDNNKCCVNNHINGPRTAYPVPGSWPWSKGAARPLRESCKAGTDIVTILYVEKLKHQDGGGWLPENDQTSTVRCVLQPPAIWWEPY